MQSAQTLLREYLARRIVLGTGFGFSEDGTLTVDAERLLAHLREDGRLSDVTVALAHPDEHTRIVGVLDAAEPRCFAETDREAFPGVLAPPRANLGGTLVCVRGTAVVLCGWEPWFDEDTHGVQRPFAAFIDMAGEGTRACQNATTANVVVTIRADGTPRAYAELARDTIVRAARFLAKGVAATASAPPAVERPLVPPPAPGAPKVVYIDQIRDQGPFVGTFLYGWPLTHQLPTLLTPAQLFEGALVTGDYRGPLGVPTYLHQNNPVVRSLLEAQARGEIQCAGIVLSRGNFESIEDKRRSGELAAHLALQLGADGVIVSIEGFGNATVDFMETISAAARRGLRAVGIIHEPLMAWSEQASHLVSLGPGMGLGHDAGIEIPAVQYLDGGSACVGAVHGYGEGRNVARLEPFALLWRHGEAGVTCRDF
jgi:glycine reductase